MENLIKRLQEEAGLTEEQSYKVVLIVKDFMDKEDLKIDWSRFFKSKYDNLSDKVKDLSDKLTEKAHPYTEKLSEVVDSTMTKVRKSAHDISMKAADFFDDSEVNNGKKKD